MGLFGQNMAMLAEHRRKQKFSIDPRGNNWANDESKFGQKLMEKFGWNKGDGLGANRDGRTEHIKISLKSDTRGVGCSKKHDDNWVAHQDDFNSLLASLNSQNESSTQDVSQDADSPAPAVLSLEQKSSTAKRVHYHKFTRGKDLSRAGTQDLDCIFGRRKSKSSAESEVNSPQVQSEANSSVSDSAGEEQPGTETNEHGVTTVATGTSVQEYFARKMAELKKAREAASKESQVADNTQNNNRMDIDSDNAVDLQLKRESRVDAVTSSEPYQMINSRSQSRSQGN